MRVASRRRADTRWESTGLTRPTSRSVASRPTRFLCHVCLAVACGAVGLPSPALASSDCPNETLRAQSDINPATGRPFSTELPDCRAYELVSTGDKQDNDLNQPPINQFYTYGWAAANGGGALWMTYDYAYANPSNGTGNVFQSKRGTGGWLQAPALAPPGSAPTWIAPVAANGDLSTVVLARFDELGNFGLLSELVEREADGSYSTIAAGLPHTANGPQADVQLSEDGSRTFLQTTTRLAGDTHGSGEQLYEWTRRDGLRVFAVDGAGEPTSSCGGAVLAGSSPGSFEGARSRDISRDGSRVAFLSPAPSSGSSTSSEFCGPSDLYMRENESTTIDISKPASGVTDYGASYVGMSADGSKVFFITRSQLTPEKTGTDPDLFEYDLSTGTLTRLSVGPPGYDDANVQSAMASADGSHVYFEAYGQLVPGAGAVFPPVQSNAELANLYVYAHGAVTFVATVNNFSQDGRGFQNFGNGFESIHGLEYLTSQVTPDGSDLLFSSASEMTAYDNRGDTEMYR
jgi:hypothetical protein